MILFHARLVGAAAAMLALAAASAAAAAPDTLACEGVFARDTTHAKLVEAFGRSNVAFL
jgi:hypothetical protein